MKKLISLLLVLCMAFSLMAMSVSAEEVPDNNQDVSFDDDLEHAYGTGIFKTEDLENGESIDDHLQGTVTRGEYAIYMARAIDPNFMPYTPVHADAAEKLTDVAAFETTNPELYHAIRFCYDKGIVNGYKDDMYHADYVVTREETCAMLYRAIEKPVKVGGENGVEVQPVWDNLVLEETDNVTTMTDHGDINDYAKDAVDFCIKYGIVIGNNDGSFGADKQDIKLVHLAAILNRTENNEEQSATSTKFKLVVESGEGYAKIVVNHAYVMQVVLSEKTLDPSKVTLTVEMNDVASLGIEGSKSHSTTIQINDFNETNPKLPDWMKETWKVVNNYKSTIVININDNQCQYNVTAEDKGDEVVFTFMPENVVATRAAWKTLVNESTIATNTEGEDDSKITIMNGSELQLGLKTLCFEDGVSELVLNDFSNLNAMEQLIRDSVMVDDTAAAYEEIDARAVIAVGTKLRVGQTEAELLTNVEIAVDGIAGENQDLGSYLVALRDATTKYDMAVKLVNALDAIVSGMNGKTVTVDVTVG